MDALERHFRAAWKQTQHKTVQVPAYGLAWDEFQSAIQQEIAKANDDITANQLLNHIADGMRYDETFTYTELEGALETLKEHN